MKKRTLAFAVCLVIMLSIMAPGAMASELESTVTLCHTCRNIPCTCEPLPPENNASNDDHTAVVANYGPPCLTIAVNGSIESGQALLFKISGEDCDSVVALHGEKNGISSICIEGLTLGKTYTVEAIGNWSWRYSISPASVNVTINEDPSQNVLNFTVSKTNNNWLSSESYGVF